MKPGGLSGTWHAIHILLTVVTAGAWLLIYLLAALASPIKRVEVTAPAGTPPAAIDAARQTALQLTPEEQVAASRKRTGTLIVLGLILTGLFLVWRSLLS